MIEKIKSYLNLINDFKYIDYIIFIFLFVITFGFLYFTGTITSGYHFIDDHWILKIGADFNNKSSFWGTVIRSTVDDLNIRFRPLYYLYYISAIRLFGQHFLVFSVFVGVLASLSFSLFYSGIRKLKYSILSSLIFVFLIFLGSQMAVWWRLGTNETIAIFFLGLAFLFMTRCLDRKNYIFNTFLFIIFLIIASLCKESFIVVIPAFLVFKVWNEQRVFGIGLRESLKNNVLLIVPLVVMSVELMVIKFVIGTNQIGYAGVTSSMSEFINGIKNIVFNPISLYGWIKLLGWLFLVYFASLFFITGNKKEEICKSLKYLSIYLSFPLLIIIPEILMHAKSGMVERYLLPTTFGLAFLTIGILQGARQKFFKILILLITLSFIYTSFGVAKNAAILFANEGKRTNHLLSEIRKNAKSESKILLVVDPVNRYEVSYSIRTYLGFYGYNNLYGYPILRKYTSDFEIRLKDGWFSWFDGRGLADIKSNPDMVIIFDKIQTDDFFKQSKFLKSEYEDVLINSNDQSLYIKR